MFTEEPLSTSDLSFSTNLWAHLQKTRSTIIDKYFLWSDGTTALRLTYSDVKIKQQGFVMNSNTIWVSKHAS